MNACVPKVNAAAGWRQAASIEPLEGFEFINPMYIKNPMKKTIHPIIAAVLELEKKFDIKTAYDVAAMKKVRK